MGSELRESDTKRDYCSVGLRQLNRAKRLECAELAPAFRSANPARQRQQAGRTPNASRQILAICEEVEQLQCIVQLEFCAAYKRWRSSSATAVSITIIPAGMIFFVLANRMRKKSSKIA